MFIHIDDDPVHTVEGPARMCTIGDDRTRTILATWIVMGSRTIVAPQHIDDSSQPSAKPITVPARYTNEWRYFVDWARAFDHPYLPTSPHVVAEFLTFENPSLYTRRAAISAINAVHRDNGFDPPARSTRIRAMMSTRTVDADSITTIIANLPTDGHLLNQNRRDALLLWLNKILRIPSKDLAYLRTDDIQIDDQGAIYILPHDLTMPADTTDPNGLYQVLARWMQVYLRQNSDKERKVADNTISCVPTPRDLERLLTEKSLPLIPQINKADRITHNDEPDAQGLSISAVHAAIMRATARAQNPSGPPPDAQKKTDDQNDI